MSYEVAVVEEIVVMQMTKDEAMKEDEKEAMLVLLIALSTNNHSWALIQNRKMSAIEEEAFS